MTEHAQGKAKSQKRPEMTSSSHLIPGTQTVCNNWKKKTMNKSNNQKHETLGKENNLISKVTTLVDSNV